MKESHEEQRQQRHRIRASACRASSARSAPATLVRVLRGVDLQAAAGERVALYGPSGSGKTTLLNLIGALDRPNAGSICIGDQDILA